MTKCRWCDWVAIELCTDGKPRRDVMVQLESHVAGRHPEEMRAQREHRRAAQEKERSLADDTMDRERENQYASRRLPHAEAFGGPEGEPVEAVRRIRRR